MIKGIKRWVLKRCKCSNTWKAPQLRDEKAQWVRRSSEVRKSKCDPGSALPLGTKVRDTPPEDGAGRKFTLQHEWTEHCRACVSVRPDRVCGQTSSLPASWVRSGLNPGSWGKIRKREREARFFLPWIRFDFGRLKPGRGNTVSRSSHLWSIVCSGRNEASRYASCWTDTLCFRQFLWLALIIRSLRQMEGRMSYPEQSPCSSVRRALLDSKWNRTSR